MFLFALMKSKYKPVFVPVGIAVADFLRLKMLRNVSAAVELAWLAVGENESWIRKNAQTMFFWK